MWTLIVERRVLTSTTTTSFGPETTTTSWTGNPTRCRTPTNSYPKSTPSEPSPLEKRTATPFRWVRGSVSSYAPPFSTETTTSCRRRPPSTFTSTATIGLPLRPRAPTMFTTRPLMSWRRIPLVFALLKPDRDSFLSSRLSKSLACP